MYLDYGREQSHKIIHELRKFPSKRAAESKGNSVLQQFSQSMIAIDQTLHTKKMIDGLVRLLKDKGVLHDSSFNSFIYHQYQYPREVGISLHHDGYRFENPIAIIILKDGGEFRIASGKLVPATVGDCILISNELRHAVVNIFAQRETLCARIDTTPHLAL